MATTGSANKTNITQYYLQIVTTSIDLYEINWPASITQLIAASLAMVNNVIVMCIILTTSLKAKRYFQLSANLAAADFWVGMSYVFVCSKRIKVTLENTGYVSKAIDCLIDVIPMTFGITSSTVFSFVLSLDRLIAIINPIRYRFLGHWYYILIAGLGWLYSFLDAFFVFVTMYDRDRLLPMCTNTGTYSTGYNVWSTSSRTTISSLAIGVCLISLFILYYKSRSGRFGNEKEGNAELTESTRTISVIASIMFTTQISSRIGYLAIRPYPPNIRSRYGNFLRIPQILNSACPLFIYLWRSTAFKMVLKKSTAIGTA